MLHLKHTRFTPSSPGNYMVTVTVTENSEHSDASVSTTEKIVCVTGSPADKYRPLTTSSVQNATRYMNLLLPPDSLYMREGHLDILVMKQQWNWL